MTENRVRKYYTEAVRKEWNRLVRSPYFKLEFDTTMHFLEKYLPKNGRILDAGGSPGRYTIELARRGYRMTLLDFTPANLDFTRRKIRLSGMQKRVEDVVEGSIADLSRFEDNTFDAVICTGGPLSQVLDRRKRDRGRRLDFVDRRLDGADQTALRPGSGGRPGARLRVVLVINAAPASESVVAPCRVDSRHSRPAAIFGLLLRP
jgi:SAM-dependent methyltransferase